MFQYRYWWYVFFLHCESPTSKSVQATFQCQQSAFKSEDCLCGCCLSQTHSSQSWVVRHASNPSAGRPYSPFFSLCFGFSLLEDHLEKASLLFGSPGFDFDVPSASFCRRRPSASDAGSLLPKSNVSHGKIYIYIWYKWVLA